MSWELVVGLEVHCQIRTATKLFSGCEVRFGAAPNTLIDPYTLGLPGTLPVPNREAVRAAIALGLATSCTIHSRSRFARKHYFYPDLPKGYQITQSDHPYATDGFLELPVGDRRRIRLQRIHLEEDAGKNTHLVGQEASLVDYNRAGAPLVEIVSHPDLRSGAEAAAYMRELRTIVRHLGISEANMEEGTMRCDANVSLRPRGSSTLGTRCEIKNLNSFRFLESAIESEARRQADVLGGGGRIVSATLSYDPGRDVTRVMRTKEEAADYRYFPEPDLPPLLIPDDWVVDIRASLPELPAARRARYEAAGLSSDDALLLASERGLAEFFDGVVATGAPARRASAWVTVELLGRLHADGKTLEDSPVSPARVGELVALIEDGSISGRVAKEVFDKVWAEDLDPRRIVERDGYRQVSDASAIETAVREVLAESPRQLEQYRAGKVQLRGYFVGQVMKKTRGEANPQVVGEVLDRLLAGS